MGYICGHTNNKNRILKNKFLSDRELSFAELKFLISVSDKKKTRPFEKFLFIKVVYLLNKSE